MIGQGGLEIVMCKLTGHTDVGSVHANRIGARLCAFPLSRDQVVTQIPRNCPADVAHGDMVR